MEDLIRRLIGPEIRLRLSLQPGLSTISADAQQIGQVLMNLVVNARDAMPGGGTLTHRDRRMSSSAHDNVDVIPGPHVALMVTDTGLGMSAEVRDRMFEPFFTTKDEGRGTGLGLSMVQAIVRQSGGHIHRRQRAEPGDDVQGLLSAPGRSRRPRRCPPSRHMPPPSSRAKASSLLAEDDRSVRRLVVSELTRRGFTVLEAEDGAAALELFRREKDRVDILVTDVVMPRMNGADLAKAAEAASGPGLKILFISGHPERAGAGLDPTGVTNLLMKPFTADTLAARIKELITGRTEADGWSV